MCFEREVEEKDAGLWLVGRVLDGKAFFESPSSLSIIGFSTRAKDVWVMVWYGGGESSVHADFAVCPGVCFSSGGARWHLNVLRRDRQEITSFSQIPLRA